MLIYVFFGNICIESLKGWYLYETCWGFQILHGYFWMEPVQQSGRWWRRCRSWWNGQWWRLDDISWAYPDWARNIASSKKRWQVQFSNRILGLFVQPFLGAYYIRFGDYPLAMEVCRWFTFCFNGNSPAISVKFPENCPWRLGPIVSSANIMTLADLSPVSIPCDWDVGGRPSLNSGYLANMP